MTEAEQGTEETALALQTEIRHARAQVVADIDELRDAIRVRFSLTHVLQSHPRIMQGLSVALGLAGVATLALIWRATTRSKQAGGPSLPSGAAYAGSSPNPELEEPSNARRRLSPRQKSHL